MELLKVQLSVSCFLTVASAGKSGGICLFKRRDVNLVLHTYSKFHFDMLVSDPISSNSWRLSTIYGNLETHLRRATWALLCLLKDQCARLWLCFGDFNEILDNSRKMGSRERPVRQTNDFRNTLDYCQLCSIDVGGSLFTRSNLRDRLALVQKRLD